MSFLLDTNSVSEWTKPKPDPGLIAWLDSVDEDRVFLSVITLAEIRSGIERLAPGQRKAALESWLMDDLVLRFEGRLLPVDAAAGEAWGRIAAGCAAMGRPVGIMDAFIAAIAMVHGLTVVTRNAAHFEHCPVAVLNPWKQ